MTTAGLAVAIGGVLELAIGVGLIWNVGRAAEWWIGYNERQRRLAWWLGVCYDRHTTRSLGMAVFSLGLFSILIVVGGS